MDSFDGVPVNRHLGLRLVARSAEGAEVTLRDDERLVQEKGVIHGGVLATLADTAAVYCFLPDLPEDRSMTSIEFKVNFLRPARAGAGEITARSRVIKRGRKIGVCEVDVHQADAHVAQGSFTYMFFRAEG